MRAPAFLVYTAGRIGVFLLTAAVLWLLGFRSWFLALGAVLLSMPLSYFLLRRQRAAFADSVERRMRERRELRAKLRGDDPSP
jgi:hypothetical protein